MTTALAEAFHKALASPDAPDDLEWKVQRSGGPEGLWEAKVSPTGILDLDTATGVVTLIPTVTGIVDEVQDIILPGAYDETLKQRVPKGVWSHDWSTWVARTDDVAELAPGDSMLPRKWKGRDWPRQAGACVVQATFNLGTKAGQDAFSNVVFFDAGPLGQQVEYSIGYNVPAGKARRNEKQQRLIAMLQWFEWCPVLFGAMPLAGTVATGERKTHEQLDAYEGKALPLAQRERIEVKERPAEAVPGLVEAAVRDGMKAALESFNAGLAADDETKAAGSMAKASTPEPVGKGPLWKHKGWHLPPYIQHVANELKKKHGESRAIAMAVGIIKNWAHGHDGKGHKVEATTQAAAQKALKQWELLKAKAAALRAAKAGKKETDMAGTETKTTTTETAPAADGVVDVEVTDEEMAALLTSVVDLDAEEPAEAVVEAVAVTEPAAAAAPAVSADAPADTTETETGGDADGLVDEDEDDDPDDALSTPFDDDPDYPTDEVADEPEGEAGAEAEETGADETGEAAEQKALALEAKAKAKKHALPDGSYPIPDADHVEKAVNAYPRGAGKGKSKADIRRHVVKHARKHGALAKVPNTWPEKTQGKSLDEELSDALESKDYPFLPGSVEERQQELRQALRDLLLPDPDAEGRVRAYCSLDATYADRVVATLNDYSVEPSEEQSFVIPYTVGEDGEVAFGDPQPVEKEVSVAIVAPKKAEGTQSAAGGDGPLGGASPLLPIARKAETLAKALVAELEGGESKSAGEDGTHKRRLRSALGELAGAMAGLGMEPDTAGLLDPVADDEGTKDLDLDDDEVLLLRADAALAEV